MSIGGEEGGPTEFHRVVRSLLNDTVRVEVAGGDTVKVGKLVGVETSFITVAVTDAADVAGGPGDGHAAVRLAHIPFRHIVSVAEG